MLLSNVERVASKQKVPLPWIGKQIYPFIAWPNFNILENNDSFISIKSLSLDPKSISVDFFVNSDVFKGPGVNSNFFFIFFN